jgi:N-acetylmuramoyl-L-alanine amidase
MTQADFEKALLALVIWREARNQGEDGMRAVGHVIRNRVFSWGSSYTRIITGKNQFTSISVHTDPETVIYPALGDAQFNFCLRIADDIYNNVDPDITMGSLYYYNPATATSQWFTDNIVSQSEVHPLKAKVGSQLFYAG